MTVRKSCFKIASKMGCSKDEIERKRLAAMERIAVRRGSIGGPIRSSPSDAKYRPYDNTQQQQRQPLASKVITCTLYLISEGRFEAKPSEFSDVLVAVFKTIPSKSYDCEKRLWSFGLEHYERLHSQAASLRPNVVLGHIPQYVLRVMRTADRECEPDMTRIDAELLDRLMPFQREGVKFGIAKKGRCMIADDMGLGKTHQALAIASYFAQDWPLLVLTTSSMRETWESKINELLPSVPLPSVVSVSSGKEKDFLSDVQAKVVITSYKMTTLCLNALVEKRFGAVILDESHLLKSYKAQSTEAVAKIAKHAQRVILLTGTPALSRPNELFTQLQLIEPKFFNFVEFGKRYCDGKQTNFGWDMSGQSNSTELQLLLQKRFLIRRTKQQVLVDLRDKTRETVILDSSLMDLSHKTKENLTNLALTYGKKKAADKHAALLTFFSESSKVKIPAICKYVDDLVKNRDKFLIFAHHRNVLEAICRTLDECRVHYVSIDGATKTCRRSALVDKFQSSDDCRCAVLSITAANAGITLTAARLVVFAELHWNPGILTQAEARAHRIGQEGAVRVEYLLAEGTSDDYVWPMLEKKLLVLNRVGLSEDTFEDSAVKMQRSPTKSFEDYFSPSTSKLIPGTNVPENWQRSDKKVKTGDVRDAFLMDDEGDELMAGVDV